MARSFGKYDEAVDSAVEKGLLGDFSPQARDRILESALLLEVPASSVVYREYEPGKVAVVLEGLLRTYLTSREGRQITVKYSGPGEFIGLPALLGGPAPARVEAVRATTALVLDPSALEELGKAEAGAAWRMAEEVGAIFCDLLISLGENAFDPVSVRLARHLVFLAVPGDGGVPEIRSTQKELAEAVGTVREVVSRSLHKFQAEGLISVEPSRIRLLDSPRLKALARPSI